MPGQAVYLYDKADIFQGEVMIDQQYLLQDNSPLFFKSKMILTATDVRVLYTQPGLPLVSWPQFEQGKITANDGLVSTTSVI